MSVPDYEKKYCIKCNELKENSQFMPEYDEYICIRCWLRQEGVNHSDLPTDNEIDNLDSIEKTIDLYFNVV